MTKFVGPYLELHFPVADEIRNSVLDKDYYSIDQFFKNETQSNGRLFQFLKSYCDFSEIEFILAVRTPPDDDGIWHDDGSRKMAFSLSLNLYPEKISGGQLYMRKFLETDSVIASISPRPYGTILLFKTGLEGFEHKVEGVNAGFRFVIAGWCS